jgi:TolA-binding protein
MVVTEMELRPTRFTKKALSLLCVVCAAWMTTACTVDSAKRHYVLAEKLWTDGKYAASVAEFEKVVAKDPHGKLGAQALLRGATTQALFLSQYSEAVKKLRQYVEASPDPSTAWEAQKEIGDLLYSKLEQYDQAVKHYQTLIQLNPSAPEIPEFMYRVGRSYFFLGQFDDARKTYEQLIRQYPKSSWIEKAQLEIGQTLLTQGEQSGGKSSATETYRSAMAAFQTFVQKFPSSPLVSEAQFGVASCLEELDQLDAAYQAYEALRGKYPSKNVIEIKLARIRERKAQRSH